MLASNLREEFNRLHNQGISFPGAGSYTGTRSVNAQDFSQWSGRVRIAVLDKNGQPIPSVYDDETSGVRPLTLDLSKLNTGLGAGLPTVEGIINEINQYYGTPKNRAVVGNLNNIQLALTTNELPGTPPSVSFDFDLENIAATASDFFLTNIQVLDETNTDITSVTSTVPSIALDPVNTYSTTNGSRVVTINTTAPHGLAEGGRVYLSNPGGAVNGIPAADINQFFTVTNVTSTSFQIEVATAATSTGTAGVAAQTALPPYDRMEAGESGRTGDSGLITANLAGNPTSAFYTVIASVAVDDGLGNLSTSQVTYRIYSPQTNLRNQRYAVMAVNGDGQLETPGDNQPVLRAKLVDANGVELGKSGGRYTTAENGYLKLETVNGDYVIAIDSLDSNEEGRPNSVPAVDATNRGFSYFFELNNFFTRPAGITDEDNVTSSALWLEVEQRLIDNPNLISLGSLNQSARPTNPDLPPLYTYERNIGDNSFIQELAKLSSRSIAFRTAGGLGETQQTIGGYAGQIIGTAATNTVNADGEKENATILMEGFTARSDSISGVNLDEELANTIIYQNAYTASARVITVTSELFDTLLEAF
jgi:flagellar hook-associated protein FlgK